MLVEAGSPWISAYYSRYRYSRSDPRFRADGIGYRISYSRWLLCILESIDQCRVTIYYSVPVDYSVVYGVVCMAFYSYCIFKRVEAN